MSSEHAWLGFAVCGALNLLALLAALSVALRARPAGRAELAVTTSMLWNFLVICPVYALGLTHHLYARTLGITSAAWFVLVLVLAAAGRGRAWRGVGREVGHAAWGLAKLPFDGMGAAFRARSLVFLVVAFSAAMLSWTAWCAYLSASWRQWDALWYHEPMVGFAIQNHGFAFADLPPGPHQKVNGYPRLCEMTDLWFAIFTDRRLVDIANHVMAPSLVLGVYVLARRYCHDAVTCMAWGCALLTMRACSQLLGSTYVDLHNAAFIIAATHYCTRPTLRLRDVWLGAVCLALAVGSKSMALVPVAVLGLIALVRVLLAERGSRRAATLGTVAGGTALIAGMAATTYVRNWITFHNPFWPDLKYDNDKLGIHWPGAYAWGADRFDAGVHRIDMNLPFPELLADLVRIPYSVPHGYYTQTYEYGIGMVWVVFPLTALALLALSFVVFRAAVGRLLGVLRWRADAETVNAAWIAIPFAAMIYASPALWSARYQIAPIGLGMALVSWAVGRRGFARLGEGAAAAVAVMTIVSFFWFGPRSRWLLFPSEAKALLHIPYPEREVTTAAALSPGTDLMPESGSPITTAVGLAREKELGRGTVIAIPDAFGSYMALFWNNQYSNRVLYVPGGVGYVARVMATPAKWAYAAYDDPGYRELSAIDSGWELVGPLNVENWGVVFRRTRW